jgi:hypothetical protein
VRVQEIRRRGEHPRLAAAEAVDRLLGVAHHEHRHRAVGAARLGEPGRQRLPLQRIGVLEFVEQEMAVARVQLQRQRGRVFLAGEQAAGQPFGVGEVDHALLRLGVLIGGEQRVAEQQAVAVERPDADVGLDRGDGFERGFQRVEVAQVGVELGAERLFEFAVACFLRRLPAVIRCFISAACASVGFGRPRLRRISGARSRSLLPPFSSAKPTRFTRATISSSAQKAATGSLSRSACSSGRSCSSACATGSAWPSV